MPIDIAIVAATAVGRILVPWLTQTGDKLGDAATEGAQSIAATIWERVKAKFSDSERDQGRIEDFEADPKGLEKTITAHLETKLKEDEAFAGELDALVHKPEAVQLQHIFGTVNITGGTVTGTVIGAAGNVEQHT